MNKSFRKSLFLKIIVSVTVAAALLLALAACFGGKLFAPQLVFDEASKTLAWEAVSGARGYRITHNDYAPVETSDTSYEITSFGQHKVTVTALASSESNDSDPAVWEKFLEDDALAGSSVAGGKIAVRNALGLQDEPLRKYYNTKAGGDLQITMPEGKVAETATVTIAGVNVLGGDYSASEDVLTIDSGFLSQFSYGASVELKIETEDEKTVNYLIKFIDENSPKLISHKSYEIKFDKADYQEEGLTFEFDKNVAFAAEFGVSVNAQKGAMELENSKGEVTEYITQEDGLFTLSSDFIKLLDTGRNLMAIHWTGGDIIIALDVYDSAAGFSYANFDYDLVDDSGKTEVLRWRHDFRAEDGAKPAYTVAIHDQNASDGVFFTSELHASLFKNPDDGAEWEFDLTSVEVIKGQIGVPNGYVAEIFAYDASNPDVSIAKSNPTPKFQPRPAGLETYIETTYEYLGRKGNFYLDSAAELTDIVHYAFLYNMYLPKDDAGVNYAPYVSVAVSLNADIFSNLSKFDANNDKAREFYAAAFQDAVIDANNLYPEATKLAVRYSPKWTYIYNNETGADRKVVALSFNMGFQMTSKNDPREADYESITGTESGNEVVPNRNGQTFVYDPVASETLKEKNKKDPDKNFAYAAWNDLRAFDIENNLDAEFEIANRAKTAKVYSSDELVFAIEQNLRPVFEETVGAKGYAESQRVKGLYIKTLEIMAEIANDKMSDFEKVTAIYDYIIMNVVYDHYASDYSNFWKDPNGLAYNVLYETRCFFLEGVIEDNLAVCNGIAKAVSVMCGIEGIECYKVDGTTTLGPHAWNKVRVAGCWYVIDATWGANDEAKQYNHNYLLDTSSFVYSANGGRTDGEGQLASDFYANDPSMDDLRGLYANRMFVLDGKVYDFVIENQEEKLILFEYLSTLEKRPEGLYIYEKVSSILYKETIIS